MRISIVTLLIGFSLTMTWADDWIMYRNDASRSGFTQEQSPENLNPAWVYHAKQKPRPAWQSPDTRMPFDYTYHPVIADGILCYGSSADCKIYGLDAKTGEEIWSFYTEAPVRFAPVIWKDSVFVGSDDGFLYCLDLHDGSLRWKKLCAPQKKWILGNDRMINKWPIRGGMVLREDKLYLAAGIWPTEGIYVYAIDLNTREVEWLNDQAGGLELDQPHGGARAKSGISAQGYLAASEDWLLIPTGRAVPAALSAKDGAFQYFHLQRYGQQGGAGITMADEFFHNNGDLFYQGNGMQHIDLHSDTFAAIPGGCVVTEKDQLTTYRWIDKETADRKGNVQTIRSVEKIQSTSIPFPGVSLIVAGNTVFCGGEKGIFQYNLESNKVTAQHEIKGVAYGLAFANGALYVSTEQGTIYCFSDQPSDDSEISHIPHPTEKVLIDPSIDEMADNILQEVGIDEGYCLDLGCGDGTLAAALAYKSNLVIYAVEEDLDLVKQAREQLDRAGLYGSRVTVIHGDPSQTHLPDYFADLIVSGKALMNDSEIPMDEVQRLQRPHGGMAMVSYQDSLTKNVRGALPGEDTWTHQYADPANTICSQDQQIAGPLGMLWFRDADQKMPQRHGRGPAPLYKDGRIFVEGLHTLRAVNAYNGRTLWEYPLPNILENYDQDHLMGTAGTGSNFCVSGERVYVATESVCLALDVESGNVVQKYHTPTDEEGSPPVWGFIACVDDTLFGSCANTDHIVKWRYLKGDMSKQFTESHCFFALDAKSGNMKWKHNAKSSIRHNTIAIMNGIVYLIDSPLSLEDRIEEEQQARRGIESSEKDPNILYAFDQETGEVLWSDEEDIYGTVLLASEKYDVLLMTYQPTRFRLDSEKGGTMSAFRASTGERLWDIEANYASRPLINDQTIYAQPSAWDLLTGEKKDFDFSRSYGCGILAGSTNLLVYRSATLGYRDLNKDEETQNYGGIRPGCWINAIPAGGLLLMPNAASGCICSYLNLASIALQTQENTREPIGFME